MHILAKEERTICEMFDVRYITRDSIEDEADYAFVDFWSGEPRLVEYGDGSVAYFHNKDADRLVSVLADSYNSSLIPGQCLKIDGERVYEVMVP